MSMREGLSTAHSGTRPSCNCMNALLILMDCQSYWDHFETTATGHLQHARFLMTVCTPQIDQQALWRVFSYVN